MPLLSLGFSNRPLGHSKPKLWPDNKINSKFIKSFSSKGALRLFKGGLKFCHNNGSVVLNFYGNF